MSKSNPEPGDVWKMGTHFYLLITKGGELCNVVLRNGEFIVGSISGSGLRDWFRGSGIYIGTLKDIGSKLNENSY